MSILESPIFFSQRAFVVKTTLPQKSFAFVVPEKALAASSPCPSVSTNLKRVRSQGSVGENKGGECGKIDKFCRILCAADELEPDFLREPPASLRKRRTNLPLSACAFHVGDVVKIDNEDTWIVHELVPETRCFKAAVHLKRASGSAFAIEFCYWVPVDRLIMHISLAMRKSWLSVGQRVAYQHPEARTWHVDGILHILPNACNIAEVRIATTSDLLSVPVCDIYPAWNHATGVQCLDGAQIQPGVRLYIECPMQTVHGLLYTSKEMVRGQSVYARYHWEFMPMKHQEQKLALTSVPTPKVRIRCVSPLQPPSLLIQQEPLIGPLRQASHLVKDSVCVSPPLSPVSLFQSDCPCGHESSTSPHNCQVLVPFTFCL